MTYAVLTTAPRFGKLRKTPKEGRCRGEQTCRCRDCHHHFTSTGNRHYFPETTGRQALDMYAEGAGITATGQVLGVKPASVFSWVKTSLPRPGA